MQGESHGADELSTAIVTCIIHFLLVLGDEIYNIILAWVLCGALDSNFPENSKTAFVFGSTFSQRLIEEDELYIADTLIGYKLIFSYETKIMCLFNLDARIFIWEN